MIPLRGVPVFAASLAAEAPGAAALAAVLDLPFPQDFKRGPEGSGVVSRAILPARSLLFNSKASCTQSQSLPPLPVAGCQLSEVVSGHQLRHRLFFTLNRLLYSRLRFAHIILWFMLDILCASVYVTVDTYTCGPKGLLKGENYEDSESRRTKC